MTDGDRSDDLSALVESLFDQYQPALFGYLYRLVGTREWAEELVQETYLRAFTARARLPGVQNHRAWLYRIATNVALNALKRQRRFSWLPWQAGVHDSAHERDAAERVAERNLVERALTALPPEYRAPLLLYSHYGFSVREVADALNLKEGAVKTRLYRAREMFRQAYQYEDRREEP
jgi:RNA polymerase sigma-70 factor (ECF subfamily)